MCIRDSLGATSTESVKVKNSKGKKVTKESRLTVYGSNMLIDEQITSSFSSLENLTLFTNSVTACLNNADNVSISPKSLEAVSYTHLAFFLAILIENSSLLYSNSSTFAEDTAAINSFISLTSMSVSF